MVSSIDVAVAEHDQRRGWYDGDVGCEAYTGSAKPSDTVLVHYTGWRQRTGETFFTTKGTSQPMALDVAHAAPGFGEALQLLRKGERADSRSSNLIREWHRQEE